MFLVSLAPWYVCYLNSLLLSQSVLTLSLTTLIPDKNVSRHLATNLMCPRSILWYL